jgi:uncharacterized membrane protein YhiD involved in acid resistance
MQELTDLIQSAPLSLTSLTINLLLSIVLAGAVSWFYMRYGTSMSNRTQFAQVLPVLSLTTVLIISVVKSSLALSLGLVGALSIVRFRTAIKEPEELIYLFIAIAIGLGLGADQRLPTLLAVAIILAYLLGRALLRPRRHRNNLFMNLTSLAPGESSFADINAVLLNHVESINLRRLDHSESELQTSYLIHCPDDLVLTNLLDELRSTFPKSEISFVEQDPSLGG